MKKGFTLAEVLLTLGIIGVISALTVPAVITSSKRSNYITGLKKANSTLNAVVKHSVTMQGAVRRWTRSNATTEFKKYFMPYLDINKDCALGAGCFASSYTHLTSSASCLPSDFATNYYKVNLADGSSVAYAKVGNFTDLGASGAAIIYVDINGPQGPNHCGRDMFIFRLYPYTNNVKADGIYSGNYDTVNQYRTTATAFTCTNSNTSGCGAKVLTEGEMKY